MERKEKGEEGRKKRGIIGGYNSKVLRIEYG